MFFRFYLFILLYTCPKSQRNSFCFWKYCFQNLNSLSKASYRILISTASLQITKKHAIYRGKVSLQHKLHWTFPVFGMCHVFVYVKKDLNYCDLTFLKMLRGGPPTKHFWICQNTCNEIAMNHNFHFPLVSQWKLQVDIAKKSLRNGNKNNIFVAANVRNISLQSFNFIPHTALIFYFFPANCPYWLPR